LVFHAYIKKCTVKEAKFPVKNISAGSVARRDLIPALKVKYTNKTSRVSLNTLMIKTSSG
jgi:hypothetical protein